jgi:hypothetical protein
VDTLDRRRAVRLVDVAPLERERLLGTHPRTHEEHRERLVRGNELGSDRLDLFPRCKGLDVATLVELHPAVPDSIGRVPFDEPPSDGLLEHLTERAKGARYRRDQLDCGAPRDGVLAVFRSHENGLVRGDRGGL